MNSTNRCAAVLIAAALMLGACKVSPSGGITEPVVKGPFTTRPTETSIPPAPEAVATTTAEFFVTWGMPEAIKGHQVGAKLVAVDVGGAAPPNSEVMSVDNVVPADGAHWGNFTFKKPTNSWPPGSYRVDVHDNGKPIGHVAFQIQ